jgi:gamma-glutamylcyclotransferase (GGCT)/AIG2-like uncharacterized protein YtfP
MSSERNTFLLFVYGTLKRGGSRHGPLATQRYRGEVRTPPRYALHDLGDYPGLIADGQGQIVLGELYEVEERLIDWLDAVEGAPDWFKRQPIEIDGSRQPVWAYFYQGDVTGCPRIASGRWDNAPEGETEP